MLLQEFDFRFEHVRGKNNELPDFLSRNPEEISQEENVSCSIEHISVPTAPINDTSADIMLSQITNPYQVIEDKHLQDTDIRYLRTR